MTSLRMEPALAKRFRSGRPCLDFAHTAATPNGAEPELVADAADLQHWLAHVLRLGGVRARPRDVVAAQRLRAAILQVARARIDDKRLPADAVNTVNAFAAAAPPIPRLTDGGELAPSAASATAALSAIARDAIDLLSGSLGRRIRVCAAEDCELMFVDSSRPGRRRWCSMERCGNLAKIRTHRDVRSATPV